MNLILNLVIKSLDINVVIDSYGVLLFNITLLVELICDARRLQSSWSKWLNEFPLGITYLIYSWFFSILPFWYDALGSQ